MVKLSYELLINIIISGFFLGILYALMAISIAFVYSIMRMINWSMGEFYMIGGYIQYLLLSSIIPLELWPISLAISSLSAALIGVLFEITIIRPLYFKRRLERIDDYLTLTTILLSLLLRSIAITVAGPYIYSPPSLLLGNIYVYMLPIPGDRLLAIIISGVALLILFIFIYKTYPGLIFRGVAQSNNAALICGIDIKKIYTLAFGIGCGLAGLSGAALAPVFLVYPTSGVIVTMKGFEIIVLAGLGSLIGILPASIIIGLAESILSTYINSSYRDAYGFLIMILVLLLRPQGLFGEKRREV